MLLYMLLFMFVTGTVCLALACLVCANLFGLTEILKNLVSRFVASNYDRQFESHSESINSECFICLEALQNEVIATCNHGYCASCILEYIRNKGNQAIKCPACRSQVLVLFRKFNPRSQQQKALRDRICEYNFKYSREPSFLRSITEFASIYQNAPTLLSAEGISFLLSSPRVKFILMMLIYLVSPFDLLPEAILGPIGLIDDSLAAGGIVRQVAGLLINYVSQQAERNRQRSARIN